MSKTLGKPESNSDVVNGEPRVLLIGYGWVGQYCGAYFKDADYVRSDGVVRNQKDETKAFTTTGQDWAGLVHYDLGIIGLPTPMNEETGQCDTSYIEDAVVKYKDVVDYFLIKSTVEIGTTDRLKEKYGVKIAMSPEYVGETLGHPLTEPKRETFLIVGGEDETVQAIFNFWRKVLHANSTFITLTAKEAEIVKYKENEFLMRLVDYWGDVKDTCSAFGASFDRVREALTTDPRVQKTHSFVYDNNRGWSGKCLPKDMNGLAYKMREAGKPLETLEYLIEKNAKMRKDYNNSVKLIPNNPTWRKK
jgi:UDPglucose 6-dehydrogenase